MVRGALPMVTGHSTRSTATARRRRWKSSRRSFHGGSRNTRSGPTPAVPDDTAAVSMNQMSNRHRLPAWGLEGGLEGATGATLFRREGHDGWQTAREAFDRASSSKYSNVKLSPGDVVRVLMPGGGGHGDPGQRSCEAVEDDLLDGFISEDAARSLYGNDPGKSG